MAEGLVIHLDLDGGIVLRVDDDRDTFQVVLTIQESCRLIHLLDRAVHLARAVRATDHQLKEAGHHADKKE